MTEDQWLNEPDFAQHVRFVDDRLSERKRRLLAVAFCRAARDLADHPDLLAAVETAERYADGAATAAELEAVRARCREVAVQEHEAWSQLDDQDSPEARRKWLRSGIAWAVAFTTTTPVSAEAVSEKTVFNAVQVGSGDSGILVKNAKRWKQLMDEQNLLHRALVLEVAGNPFAPVEFPADWRTSTAVALARQMYKSRDFSLMPILADALQDAGCDSDAVLNHCRDANQLHVRGCWVVDGVLGKG
jgi:hypothetical protein